jgi:hypothetical protein
MPSPRIYATAGAFRRALEERLKRASLTEQIDLNRLRRQVSFDRLLARLFREEPAPWALKGGYALELRFKNARSTVDIDLTLQRVVATTSGGGDTNQAVGKMLRRVAQIPLGDWFEYSIGAPVMDLTAAPMAGPAIRSKLEWMGGSLPDSTWTPASETWLCSHSKQLSARTGWDSPASSRRGSG